MYKSFFGLRENPFNGNPDPRYLYFTPNTRKALEQLTYGLQYGKGLILLTGEVGTGKTTLVNHLLAWLRERNTPTAFIFNSRLTVNHLLDFILSDFGVPIDFRLNGNMLMRLKLWLMERHRADEKPVLIVDEAQGLSIEALEEVRLLLNLEADGEKLLQIVLVGQPELEDKLKRPELRQIRQRIELRCSTTPLEPAETRSYIAERLRIAGADGTQIFPVETMDAAHAYSRGIPRIINLLCDHALINAYAEQCPQVPVWAVEEAADDFLLQRIRPDTAGHRGDGGARGNPPALQSTFETKVARSFTTVEADLHDRSGGIWPSAAAALADEKSATADAKRIVTPIRRSPDSNQGKIANSTIFVPITPGVSGRTWIRIQASALARLERTTAAARQNKQLVNVAKMVRGWVIDFKYDWNAMINAMELPQSAKFLFQWLRRPALSKRLDSSRKQPG